MSGRPIAATQPAQADPFAPPPLPATYDAQRARLPLAQIPDDPAAPAGVTTTPPELPRQALRRMAEARRLFAEQRYTEAGDELEKALHYNANNIEAYRLLALASLLSGKDLQSKLYAERGLEIRPDDLTCHYVLARRADKAEDATTALAEYRAALKCPITEDNRDDVILTRYHLGLLLTREGYYQAAAEQFEAFEAAIAELGGKEPQSPELVTILRVKRASAPTALAECYTVLRQFGPAADALAAAVAMSPKDGDLAVSCIRALVRAQRYDQACETAAAHVEATNADFAAVELLWAVYRRAKRIDRGLEAIRQVAAAHPDRVDIALLHADAQVAAGNLKAAIQTLTQLAERAPDEPLVRWKLVALHRLQADWPAWLGALASELAFRPQETDRAEQELAQLSTDAAARAVDEALGRSKGTRRFAPSPWPAGTQGAALDYCFARLADRLNRTDDARQLFERAAQHDPAFLPGSLGAAEMHVHRCQWDAALKLLEQVKTDDRAGSAAIETLRGQCDEGLDKVDEAIAHYERALKDKPGDVNTSMLLGKLFDRAGRPDDAERLYQQIIAAQPDRLDAREALVRNLWSRWSDRDKLKRLTEELTDLQRRAPESPAAIRCSAIVRYLMRQPPDLAGYVQTLATLVESAPDDMSSRRALAMGLYLMRDYGKAAEQAKRVLASLPYDPEAGEMLALAQMRELEVKEAATTLARMLTYYPNRESLLRNLGEVRLVQQDFDAAVTQWQKLLALNEDTPRKPAYRSRLIQTCLIAGRVQDACRAAEQWLGEADEKERGYLRLFVLASDVAAGDFDRYIARCREWIKAEPESQALRNMLLGIATDLPVSGRGGLLGAKRFDEAIAQATAWLTEKPSDTAAGVALIQVLQATQQYDAAIEVARQDLSMASSDENRLVSLQVLAETLLGAKRYEEALDAARQLAALVEKQSPDFGDFDLDELVGHFLAQAKRYDEATSHYNRMIGNIDEREARIQQLQGQMTELAQKLQLLREQQRNVQHRASVLRAMSFIYQQQGLKGLTRERLRDAFKLTPADAGINNDLGYMMADAGMDLGESERMLRYAVGEVLWLGLGDDSRQPAYMDSLGWVLYKKGRFAEALSWLSIASKLKDGQDPVIYDHLGDTHWRLGHKDEAVVQWKQALKLNEERRAEGRQESDPEFEPAVRAKIEAAAKGGKPAVATAPS